MNADKKLVLCISIALYAGLLGITILVTGCGIIPSQHGHILISADSEGMRAFGDTMNGMITNGKASPDVETPHWQVRREQEVEKTKRSFAPSFWQKLSGSEAQPTTAKGS